MKQFEVGRIYQQDNDKHYIRITKRTENRIWFEFITTDYSTWTLNYTWKQVRTNSDGEYLWLDIGISGECYRAKDDVTDKFDDICAEYKAEKQRRAELATQRLMDNVHFVEGQLEEYNLPLELIIDIVNKFSDVSEEVWKIIKANQEKRED